MSEPFSLKKRVLLAGGASLLLMVLASVLAPLSPEWRAYARGLEFAVLAGLSILAVAALIAIPLGMLAASGPRAFDTALRFVCDWVSSLPTVFVAAVFWAWSSGPLGYVCALGTLRGLEQAWLLRCELVRLEAEDPESVPRSLGRTPLFAFLRQRLVRALGPLFVSASFSVAWLTALDAALTQAGLRPQSANITWGLVLGSSAARSSPWPALFAAGSVVLITVALHALFRRPAAG
jgi:ABC-type dipeptide/oligopeptide/nickel transport system permease subunit